MMEYFKECLQDFNKPSDWQDTSWHNDACPSFEYNGYHIYIDHPVPSERDSGADHRYHVSISYEYGEMGWTLETDNFSEVLEALKVPYLERPLLHDIDLYLEEELRQDSEGTGR